MQPLRVRMPRLALWSGLLLLLSMSFLPLQELPQYTAGLLALHYVVLLGSAASLLLVRLWAYLVVFGLNHERTTAAGTGWCFKHRHLASARARIVLFLGLFVAQAVIFTILATALSESWTVPSFTSPFHGVINIIGSVFVLIYGLIFVLSASKLKSWAPAAFGLAQEYFLLGAGAIVSEIIFLSLLFTGHTEAAQVVAVLGCSFNLLVLLALPLALMKTAKAPFPQFSFHRALSPKAFDDLNLDSPPETLLAFVSKPNNKKLFVDFLASEHCLENLQFLDAIDAYKAELSQTTNLSAALAAAQKLYDVFLKEGSTSQVSVASNISKSTVRALTEAAKRVEEQDQRVLAELMTLFDGAGRSVFNHLSSDSFSRFLQSPAFAELQEEREFAPLLFSSGARPWTSWIAKDAAEAKKPSQQQPSGFVIQ